MRHCVFKLPLHQDQDPAVLEQAVGGMLRALGCPFTPLNTSTGSVGTSLSTLQLSSVDELRYCAESPLLADWLNSTVLALALRVLSLGSEASGRADGILLAQEDVQREIRCRQAIATVQRFEAAWYISSQVRLMSNQPGKVQQWVLSVPLACMCSTCGACSFKAAGALQTDYA